MPNFIQFQLRRDTSANWTSANPVLAQGEFGFETNTGAIKLGDGSTAWNSLAYYSTKVRTGSGNPAGGLGVVGDLYIDSTDGELYLKTAVSTWTLQGNLTGPTGATGPTGPSLPNGDKGDVTVFSGGASILFTGSLKSAGAVGDGTANDRPAFVSLDGSLPANNGILITGGRYRVLTNLTITRPLEFASGGRIVVPTGVTVTINAPIKAGIEQIFELEGTGSVVCSSYYVSTRYVEWWGGIVGADTSPGLVQALKSGTNTIMQARDYVTTATISIPAFATLQGAGCNYEGDNTSTRVLLASASVTPIVQLGSTNASPPDINSAPYGAQCSDIYFGRNTNPNANTVSVAIGWSRSVRVTRCRATNSIIGYQIKNAVSPFIDDCFAKRDVAIAGGQGADAWTAYHIDSTGTLPAAGGNASVWLTRAQAECNLSISGSTAFKLNGRISDVFITQPETVGHNYGLDIQGDKAGSPSVGSNVNVTIENPVIDQSTVVGIRIRDVNQWGAVQVIQPYVGPAALDGIAVSNCDGHVGIKGGQLRMNVATGGKAVSFVDCRNPVLNNTSIGEATLAAVTLTNVSGGIIQPLVQNVTATCAAAVNSTANVTKTTIRPSINGAASKVTNAHKSDASSNQNNVISLVGAVTGVVVTPRNYVAGAEAGSSFPESDTQIARKTANQAMTVAAATAITDLAIPIDAGATYNFEAIINIGTVTGTSPTVIWGVTGPASPTVVSLRRDHMTTAVLSVPAVGVAFGNFGAAAATVANTVTIMKGTIVNGANAGTLQITAQMAGTTPNMQVLQGSNIVLTRVSVT